MKRIGWLLLVIGASLGFIRAQQLLTPTRRPSLEYESDPFKNYQPMAGADMVRWPDGTMRPSAREEVYSLDRPLPPVVSYYVGSDGKVRNEYGDTVSSVKTYHFIKKGSNEMVCDQTGEKIAASSTWRD